MKKALIIYNPVAGTAEADNYVLNLSNQLCMRKYRVELLATQRKDHATDYCSTYGDLFDLVVVIGGDGTLSEVVSGILKNEKRPEIAIIPTGSVNDFASGLGFLDLSKEELVNFAVDGRPTDFDVASLNEKYFYYVAAFGVFTSVAYRTSQGKKMPSASWPIWPKGLRI